MKTKRLVAILLTAAMTMTSLPVTAFAADCGHHTEHTADCGYREGNDGAACTHKHTEDCYPTVQDFTTEETYAVELLGCEHKDHPNGAADGCGFRAAVEAKKCIFKAENCEQCNLKTEETDCEHKYGAWDWDEAKRTFFRTCADCAGAEENASPAVFTEIVMAENAAGAVEDALKGGIITAAVARMILDTLGTEPVAGETTIEVGASETYETIGALFTTNASATGDLVIKLTSDVTEAGSISVPAGLTSLTIQSDSAEVRTIKFPTNKTTTNSMTYADIISKSSIFCNGVSLTIDEGIILGSHYDEDNKIYNATNAYHLQELAIFGGGNGTNVTGNPVITIKGKAQGETRSTTPSNAPCSLTVYGGGYNSNLNGSTTINVTSTGNVGDIYGGGLALDGTANVTGDVTIDVAGSLILNQYQYRVDYIDGYPVKMFTVHGGGYAKSTDTTATTAKVRNVNITISGTVGGIVGGGTATNSGATAIVEGNVDINFTGTQHSTSGESIVGGGTAGGNYNTPGGNIISTVGGTVTMTLAGKIYNNAIVGGGHVSAGSGFDNMDAGHKVNVTVGGVDLKLNEVTYIKTDQNVFKIYGAGYVFNADAANFDVNGDVKIHFSDDADFSAATGGVELYPCGSAHNPSEINTLNTISGGVSVTTENHAYTVSSFSTLYGDEESELTNGGIYCPVYIDEEFINYATGQVTGGVDLSGLEEDLNTKLNAVKDGTTVVKLTHDYDLVSPFISLARGTNVILDLNGYELSSAGQTITVNSGATLKIIDSSTGKTGKVLSTNGSRVIWNKGSVTLEGVYVENTGKTKNAVYNDKTLVVTGSEIIGTLNGIYNTAQGTITISDSEVTGKGTNSAGIYNLGNITKVENCTITATTDINHAGTTATKSVTITSGTYKTIKVTSGGTLNINGGSVETIEKTGTSTKGNIEITDGIFGTLTNESKSNFTITGGSFTTLNAPTGTGTYKISGGKFKQDADVINAYVIDGKIAVTDSTDNDYPTHIYDAWEVTIDEITNGSLKVGDSVVSDKVKVKQGESVVFTLVPDAGYRVASVKLGDDVITVANNQFTITPTANATLTVVFEKDAHTINVAVTGNGVVKLGDAAVSGDISLDDGVETTFTLVPDAGYRVASVTVNGTEITVENNEFKFTPTANATLAVEFEKDAHTINVAATDNGAVKLGDVAVSGDISLEYGVEKTFTLVPDAGYRVASVTVDGTEITVENNEFKFTPTANATLTVMFEKITEGTIVDVLDNMPTKEEIEALPEGEQAAAVGQAKKDILQAKQDYEVIKDTGTVSESVAEKLHNRLAEHLDAMVDVVVDVQVSIEGVGEVASVDEDQIPALLMNMTADEAKDIAEGQVSSYKFIITVSPAGTLTDEQEASISNAVDDTTMGVQYDVTVKKVIDGTDKGELSELEEEIEIVFDIPAELLDVPARTIRTFTMLHTHYKNGKYTTTELADTDNEKPTYTVLADKFSIFTLTYKDTLQAGGSSGGGRTKYDISFSDSLENGSVSVSTTKAKKNTTVTVTVNAEAGYTAENLKVIDKNGREIDVKDLGNGKYTFIMPASKVEIYVDFVKEVFDAFDDVQKIVLTIDDTAAWVFDRYVTNDVAPVIRNERTMLPIRFVAEALGATVGWNEAEQKVTITKDDLTIEIFIGKALAMVNGEPVVLDSPAFIENSRTYLPLRFVAENLGANVIWDGDAKTVTIIPVK